MNSSFLAERTLDGSSNWIDLELTPFDFKLFPQIYNGKHSSFGVLGSVV